MCSVRNSWVSKRIAQPFPALRTTAPLVVSLSGTCLSRNTGQEIHTSMGCPVGTFSGVLKKTPLLLISTLSLVTQSEGAGPSDRYFRASRKGKRRLARRSPNAVFRSSKVLLRRISGISLRKNKPAGIVEDPSSGTGTKCSVPAEYYSSMVCAIAFNAKTLSFSIGRARTLW